MSVHNVSILPGHAAVFGPFPPGTTLTMVSSPPGGEALVTFSTASTPVAAQKRHTVGVGNAVPSGATMATAIGMPGNYQFIAQ